MNKKRKRHQEASSQKTTPKWQCNLSNKRNTPQTYENELNASQSLPEDDYAQTDICEIVINNPYLGEK